jgi:hypothetical protein
LTPTRLNTNADMPNKNSKKPMMTRIFFFIFLYE